MWRLLGVLLLTTSVYADRSYVQELLNTDVQGEELLAAYDMHYDALSPEAQMKEKAAYPKDVYQELLEHRRHHRVKLKP